MESKLKIGDKVRLASGGPLMTVKKVGTVTDSDEPAALCQWFDGGMKLCEALFHPDSLEPDTV